jgi:hypothetical protein
MNAFLTFCSLEMSSLSAIRFAFKCRIESLTPCCASEKRLGKCDTCKDVHEHLESERDPVVRAQWKAKRLVHSKFVKEERLTYHEWRRRCAVAPEKYLCVIIDGSPYPNLRNMIHVWLMFLSGMDQSYVSFVAWLSWATVKDGGPELYRTLIY